MHKKLLAFCAALSFWKVFAVGLVLAVLFEAITLGFRIGLSLQSTRDTAALGAYTFGLRVHHGYVGLSLCRSVGASRSAFGTPCGWSASA
jgi:hypothetical protein